MKQDQLEQAVPFLGIPKLACPACERQSKPHQSKAWAWRIRCLLSTTSFGNHVNRRPNTQTVALLVGHALASLEVRPPPLPHCLPHPACEKPSKVFCVAVYSREAEGVEEEDSTHESTRGAGRRDREGLSLSLREKPPPACHAGVRSARVPRALRCSTHPPHAAPPRTSVKPS